jgi:ABC-type multidrug transport system fused ATPase/permease subunit
MKTVDQLKLVYAKSPALVKRWMGVNILSAFALAVSEYVTAISIQMLLVGLGLLAATSLPKFFHDVPMGLGLALSALVLTAFLRATFQTLNYQSSYEVRETFVKHLRTLFFKDIFYSKNRRSKSLQSLQHHIGEIFPKASNWLFFWIAMFVALVQAAGIALFLMWISVPMTLVSLGLIGVLGVAILSINRWIKEVGQEAPRSYNRLLGTATRAIRGLIHIKLSRREEQELLELERDNHSYYRTNSKALLGSHVSGGLPVAFGGLLLAAIIAVGRGPLAMDAAQILAFVYLFVRFSQQVSQVMLAFGQIATFSPQADLCLQFLSEQEAPPPPRASGGTMLSAAPLVSVRHVSFQHSASEAPILNDLSFEAGAGQMTLLSGRSGSGKTTLSHLVLGFYDPSQGEVLIGGLRPDRFLEKHFSEVAYVEAQAFLFRGSLRDNLCWGLEKPASDAEIREVLARVDLANLSLDIAIEETGQPLSTGQQQRLSIARALLRRPRFLVVDEPTAHLDDRTETLICSVLAGLKGSTTLLAISHQPRLKEIADQVIELSLAKSSAKEPS